MHQHRLFVLFHPGEVGFSVKSCHKGGRKSRSRVCVWNNKNHESELSQGVTSWTRRFYVWNNIILKIITENNTNEWDFETNFSDASPSINDVFLWQKQIRADKLLRCISIVCCPCYKGSRSRICVWNNKNHESELSQGVTSWTSRFYVWNNSTPSKS